jgi:hypothetical protein
MSGSPSYPWQEAVYTRLSGDSTLTTTLGVTVYDVPPDDGAFPRITIGEQTEAPNDTMGKTGRDVTITVHVWTRDEDSRSKRPAQLIMNRVDALLDRWAPTVSGWTATEALFDGGDGPFTDVDGLTQHGARRYRIHIYAT